MADMQSLVLEAPGRLVWRKDTVPVPLVGEALVSSVCVGICGSDLHAFAGQQPVFTYPRRLGHELAVRIVEADSLAAGTLCAVDPYLCCRRCAACRRGFTNCCEELVVLGIHRDGGCAPFFTVPATQLYPSPVLSAEILALVEPLVVGRHAIVRSRVVKGEPTLVTGLGPIGLAAAFFARDIGATLALVDARADRRRAAGKVLEQARVLAPGRALERQLRTYFGGDLPRVVVDATGNEQGMQESYRLTGPGGRMVCVGIIPGDFAFPDPDFHRRELTVLASRNGRSEDFRHVLARLERGMPEAAKLITHRYALEELPGRFAALATTPGLVKAMIAVE